MQATEADHGPTYSIVVSVFAIVILSVLGSLYKSNHHTLVGSVEDPEDGAVVAKTVFGAVMVYAVCIRSLWTRAGFHGTPMHRRESIPFY